MSPGPVASAYAGLPPSRNAPALRTIPYHIAPVNPPPLLNPEGLLLVYAYFPYTQ